MFKTEWELKEEVLLSIAWEEPTLPVAFNIQTITEMLDSCVTLEQTQNGTLLFLAFRLFPYSRQYY